MTMKMAALQPEQIIVDSKEGSHEMEEDIIQKCGPDSPDGVDGLADDADECESDGEESVHSGSESDSEEEDAEVEEEEPVEELDAAALLAFSKSRLEKAPQPEPPATEPTSPTETEEADDNDNEISEEGLAGEAADDEGSAHISDSPDEEKKTEGDSTASAAASPTQDKNNDNDTDDNVVKDQAYYLELAMRKAKEAEVKAKNDEDPGYLLKLAEQKVQEANAKAKQDEEEFEAQEAAAGETVVKPAVSARATRSENSELWALLNYSKMRLETGATPQVGGGKKGGSKNGSVRGDDNQSVSSKLSKSSKRSMGSKRSITAPVTVVGGPGDLASPLTAPPAKEGGEKTDVPFPDVTDDGNESVEGSVSLENDSDNENDESDNSEDEDESSDEEEDEEEDDLPDFLKDDGNKEDNRALYEAAKFKAASILSVSEEKLTDVQMLQAIAIAEEAARKGDEKFSTRRSLFKLNEARVEDLKSFLNMSMGSTPKSSSQQAATKQEREAVGWGIGRGRLMKKLGCVVQDFKEKCNEIDDRKQQERAGQPTTKEMMSAAMLDLKAQIDEYEKIVKTTKGSK